MTRLTTVLIVALIGVTGMLGLRGLGRQLADPEAVQARILVADMASRIRANAGAVPLRLYAGAAGRPFPADCTGRRCAAMELVQQDVEQWQRQVAALLADGHGRLDSAGSEIRIVVEWGDPPRNRLQWTLAP